MLLLSELYKIVDKEMYKDSSDNIQYFQEILSKTLAGDIFSKNQLLKKIKTIISEIIDNKDYKKLIQQYHIDYFQPIYIGKSKTINQIVNKNILSQNTNTEVLLDKLTQIVFQELYGLSVIDEFSYGDIKGINEISCNSYEDIRIQVYGQKIHLPKLIFKNNEEYKKIVKKSISFDAKSDLKPDCPEVLCQRINGARVTALMPPYSKECSLNIRYFDVEMIRPKQFIKLGTSTKKVEIFTDNIVQGRPNIIITGDQGTGKTTYILRIIGSMPNNISIATIEPMFELNPDIYFPNKDIKKLQFLPKLKNPENAFETCLRLGRDLIINGEIRSPEEAIVQLKAWTRQGRGSIGSFHTSSVRDYIFDFKNLLMQKGYYFSEYSAMYDIARATDLVYHLAVDRRTGKRYINEISEIILCEDSKLPFKINTIFKYNKEKETIESVNKLTDDLIKKCLEYEFNEENLNNLKEIGVY